MWRFLCNRRLILRLHIQFSGQSLYWAHRAVIFAIARLSCFHSLECYCALLLLLLFFSLFLHCIFLKFIHLFGYPSRKCLIKSVCTVSQKRARWSIISVWRQTMFDLYTHQPCRCSVQWQASVWRQHSQYNNLAGKFFKRLQMSIWRIYAEFSLLLLRFNFNFVT